VNGHHPISTIAVQPAGVASIAAGPDGAVLCANALSRSVLVLERPMPDSNTNHLDWQSRSAAEVTGQ
jgi:hypothetical protein